MTETQAEKDFVHYIVDLMQSIGPVQSKRMFGGYGLFLEGLMFGLIVDNTLYLKADKDSEQEFKGKGLEAFTYQKKDKAVSLSYFQAPEEALENYEEMNSWANKAYAAALRAALSKG
jgi:DNA transformation protein